MNSIKENQFDLVLLMQLWSGFVSASALAASVHKKKRRQRRWWIRPIYQKRYEQGDYYKLVQEMRLFDTDMFFHYTRMTIEQFDDLLAIVGPHITKRSHREPLNPEHRLLITLRFLATGSSQQTLAFQFRVGKTTICHVVSETCSALWKSLKEKVFPVNTKENWLKIAREFENKWHFPHCLGAIDGKHFRIQCPTNTGSQFFNYKKYFSMVLIAVCDADYKFILIDVGGAGSESDGGYFFRSNLGQALEKNQLNLPPPKKLGEINQFPYVIVGDEAFPLKNYLMRPFPGQNLSKEKMIFNYRLSRARRIIENAFGILVSRWRLFQGPIIAKLENIEYYILAAICLHNYLCMNEQNRPNSERKYYTSRYIDNETQDGFIAGEWRSEICNSQLFKPIPRTGSNNAKKTVFELRNQLSTYFMSAKGSVPWQEKHIHRGTKRLQ